jgi:hypothetical protein
MLIRHQGTLWYMSTRLLMNKGGNILADDVGNTVPRDRYNESLHV